MLFLISKVLDNAIRDFEYRGIGKINTIVIDYIFHQVKRIKIEEMPYELIDSKEKEMILKLEPPFNHETASSDYYDLRQSLELD